LVVGCGEKSPTVEIANPIVEKAILGASGLPPTGELTKANLEKVTNLSFRGNKLTEIPKELEKLTQLTSLNLAETQLTNVKGLEKLTRLMLYKNPDLTEAQIAELQKALTTCRINSRTNIQAVPYC
jgi:Leucine-rich repeat (LRR) protein